MSFYFIADATLTYLLFLGVILFHYRCNTDILFGKNCGLHTLVVLSGVTSMEHLEEWAASSDEEKHKLLADYVLPEIGDLLSLINENYS